jgi:hypothetical protein
VHFTQGILNASSQTDKSYYINIQKVDGYEKASKTQKQQSANGWKSIFAGRNGCQTNSVFW